MLCVPRTGTKRVLELRNVALLHHDVKRDLGLGLGVACKTQSQSKEATAG